MKYSIIGNLHMSDKTYLVNLFNTFTLWKLKADIITDRYTQEQSFNFEVWLNTESEKTNLFNLLKPYVDEFGEEISWHECTHEDEAVSPCLPVETYRGE